MLDLRENVPLAPLTTLGLGGPARAFVRVESIAELREAVARPGAILVLGGGSNLVVRDEGFDGLVIALGLTHVEIADGRVTAGAGVVWDELVARTVTENLAGFECLSGIPGLVGATPMQNVGAYGQEVSDTITHVRTLDRETGELVTFTNEQCGFAYRHSVFRGLSRYVIVEVTFQLAAQAHSRPLAYAELCKALGIASGETAPLALVRETIIRLRRGKGMVVDAADPESRSAGSFFTNPIVAPELAATLPADAPRWPQPDGRVKLSAAWLIERAGFTKGLTVGGVGISAKHALALVNRGGTTEQLLALARSIQDTVRGRMGIELHPEPIIV